MSEIEKMIHELCPIGVEFKELNTVLKSISTGLNPRKNFKLNSEDATNYYVTVKEFTSGKIIFNEKTDRVNDDALKIIQNRSKLEYNDILLSGIGTIGKVALVDIPVDNWNCSESVFLLKPRTEVIVPKYLVYILQGNEVQNVWNTEAVGSTLRGIRKSTLESLVIPIPPIAVQRKIVEILDNFSELTAELTAELEKRKKQYEFYRDKLLSFNNIGGGIRRVKLGDIGTMKRGSGIQKKDFVDSGFPCIHYGQVHTKFGTFTDKTISFVDKSLAKAIAHPGDLIIATTSEDVGACCKAVAWVGNTDIAVSGDATIYHHNQNPKYMSYLFQTKMFAEQKSKCATGAKVIRVSPSNILNFTFPFPAIAEQERIVSILDRFESLCSDISAGIPAEINARQKQYEYYRDKLLTFNRA